MGQATSLEAPFNFFDSWSIRDVEELRKKYFLMDLNFGLDAVELKDWLDIDEDSAKDIISAFCGEGAESISAVNLLCALAMCVKGDAEEKIQVIFACFDFEDLQKLDPASLGVLFLATACGTFSILRLKIQYEKDHVRKLVATAFPTGAKDIHIGSFQKWCDEKIEHLKDMHAVDVILAAGFQKELEPGTVALLSEEDKAAFSDQQDGVTESKNGQDAPAATDGEATESKVSSSEESSTLDPLKSAMYEKPEAGTASAAFTYRGPEAERRAKLGREPAQPESGEAKSGAMEEAKSKSKDEPDSTAALDPNAKKAAAAAVESLTQKSAMFEKSEAGSASPLWEYRGPTAEAAALAGYAVSDADAIEVD